MVKPAAGFPVPLEETNRLRALASYGVLDTAEELAFDDLTQLAARLCGAPVALVSLVAAERQWFKSRQGLDACETPRDQAFCAHAICTPGEVMVVPDALADPRFRDNALVTGPPHVRFYAGAPLVTPTGDALGTLCVIDRVPRTLGEQQIDALRALSRQVVAQLELRRARRELEENRLTMERAQLALSREATVDAVSGIPNRHTFDARLASELARSERENAPLALALVDVDGYRPFLEAHGPAAANEALRHIARLLAGSVRAYDFVARYGEDEFVVLLPGTAREGAVAVTERMRQRVAEVPWPAPTLTVSIGIAVHGADRVDAAQDAPALLAQADRALFAARRGGRNRVGLSA